MINLNSERRDFGGGGVGVYLSTKGQLTKNQTINKPADEGESQD